MHFGGPQQHLRHILETGHYSDLTFTCNGQEFRVHKAVVCQQSCRIAAALEKFMGQEAETNTYCMDHFSQNTVRRFVQFLYTDEYSDWLEGDEFLESESEKSKMIQDANSSEDVIESLATRSESENKQAEPATDPATPRSSLLEHVNANAIGEYYYVPNLVTLANSKIRKLLLSKDMARDPGLISSLPRLIDMVGNSTGDPELPDILATAVAANMSQVLSAGCKNSSVFSDFAVKVMHKCAEEMQARDRRLDDAKLDMQARDEQLQDAMAENMSLSDKLATAKANCSKTLVLAELVARTKSCRNISCMSTNFKPQLDVVEGVVRCSACRCKHYPAELGRR